MLQATHLTICHPKLKIYYNFRAVIPTNKQNMFIAILLSFFITYFANFIYSELPNSIQVEAYSVPYQRFKMTLLAKIINSSTFHVNSSVFTTESNIWDGTFWEKHFQPSTISAVHYLHKKLHLRCSTSFWIRLCSC